MDLSCEQRLSDSPFIERIWRSQGEQPGAFISIANSGWSMVVSKIQGKSYFTVRGPEIRATPAYHPEDAEFFGIQFKQGTLMPTFPAAAIKDRCDAMLPTATGQTFWLNGAT